MAVSTSEFRKGLKVELNGEPFVMVDFQHVKPGKGGAFVRTRLKSLWSGNVIDKTFRSGEKVETPDLEERAMQYLYPEGENLIFMDNETYEQLAIPKEVIGDGINFLKENIDVTVLFHNQKPIGVDLPYFVELEVVETDPGIKGDTASGGSKPATLETGAVVQVPLFVKEGDLLKIDTRDGSYIERVSGK